MMIGRPDSLSLSLSWFLDSPFFLLIAAVVVFPRGTGSGKSTILKLLSRLYDPQSGSIELQGIDIKSVTIDSLRRNIGIVPQDNILFNCSVRDNIAYGKPSASQSEIESATR